MRLKTPLLLTWLLFANTGAAYAQQQADDYEQLMDNGRFLLAQKRFPEAQACFKKYAERYSSDPLSYFLLGTLADESGEFLKAVPLYAKSLSLAKSQGMDSEELRVNLGNTLLKLNYYDEAIFDYKRAIEINNKNQAAHLNLGKALLLKGSYGEAIDELNRCTELGLEEASLPLLRALALKNSGRAEEGKKEALRYLERSGSKNPELRKTVLDLF
jgi:tetratricopeptide (TPR) repeat protein